MPFFARKGSGSALKSAVDAADDLQGDVPVPVQPKAREVDKPDHSHASETPVRHLACTEEHLVADAHIQGGAVAVGIWRPNAGKVGQAKVRDVKGASDKLCALAGWGSHVWIGCFDGTIFRLQWGSDPAPVVFTKLPAGSGCIEIIILAGEPGESNPELCCVGTSKGAVRCIAVESGDTVGDIPNAHQTAVSSLSWAPSARTLVSSADKDQVIKCWTQDGKDWICAREVNGFIRGGGELRRTVWDAATATLIAGDSTGNVYLWPNVEEVLMSSAEMPPPKIVNEGLASTEWLSARAGDVVIGDTCTIKVLDAATGSVLRTIARPEGSTMSGLAACCNALFVIEPDNFPKCTVNVFDLPQRKLHHSSRSSAPRSNASSPLPYPVAGGPSTNNSFASRDSSPGPAKAGSVGAIPIRKQGSTISMPPAAGGRTRGGTNVVRRGSMDTRPPPQPPAVQIERVSPAPVTAPAPAPAAAATAAARSELHLKAERAARTQGSLDFDDFVTNRSMGEKPDAVVIASVLSRSASASASGGPGGTVSDEIAGLFAAAAAEQQRGAQPAAGAPQPAPPADGQKVSQFSNPVPTRVSPEPAARTGSQLSAPEGMRASRTASQPIRAPPRPPPHAAAAGPSPPLAPSVGSPTQPQSQSSPPLSNGRSFCGTPDAQLHERVQKLEAALQLLGGISQLEKVKQVAVEREDYAQARSIKEVIDSLSQRSLPPPAQQQQPTPPSAPAPPQGAAPAPAAADPLAGLF
eukprot:TRINITY_DN340_c0_g1_i2.p1 TRINITY_DN340_c0_g1~~TRINITY_DN340_c0_g1_i2.p1  ORF type:complete len:749 (+),score=163.63 TRINITY_DN340_c0_g1_i2:147-2393(+)